MTLSVHHNSLVNGKSVTRSEWPRYLLFLNGRWRWRPTKQMRTRGFNLVSFERELTDETLLKAAGLNRERDRVRKGKQPSPRAMPHVAPCVYVVGFGPYVKIGFSADFNQRIEELECRLPETLTIYATLPGSRAIEAALHAKYASARLRGEWFRREGKLSAWLEAGCPFNGGIQSKIER